MLRVKVSNLAQAGPIIKAHFTLPQENSDALVKAGKLVPDAIQGYVLIDTGATKSGIAQGLAAKLGLTQTGTIKMSTASHTDIDCPIYAIGLVLPNDDVFEGPVTECPGELGPYTMLLGRDILSHCQFNYDGENNCFDLHINM